MKLFFVPGACSLTPNIVAHEAGLEVTLNKVDPRTKLTASGANYLELNPKGYVPALQLDNGEVLTESAIIAMYLADQRPAAKLIPAAGSFERVRMQEWMHFVATELHKGFSPLWNPALPAQMRQATLAKLGERFDLVSLRLGTNGYVFGEHFTVADAYLFTVLSWSGMVGIELAKWPVLAQFVERIGARPAVKAAIAAESK